MAPPAPQARLAVPDPVQLYGPVPLPELNSGALDAPGHLLACAAPLHAGAVYGRLGAGLGPAELPRTAGSLQACSRHTCTEKSSIRAMEPAVVMEPALVMEPAVAMEPAVCLAWPTLRAVAAFFSAAL
jgi:hypothetical protein